MAVRGVPILLANPAAIPALDPRPELLMMTEESRERYDDRVGAARAIRSAGVADLDDDPTVMLHEQIARLRWLDQQVSLADQDVFDLGCGTGFNSEDAIASWACGGAVEGDIAPGQSRSRDGRFPGGSTA
jgi:hypothetical protein